MLTIVQPSSVRTIVRTVPAKSALVAWNARSEHGWIDLTVYRADGRVSAWLPYVEFRRGGRRSICGSDDVARIETDIVHAAEPIVAIEIRSDAILDAVTVSTPVFAPPRALRATVESMLDVPPISQYLDDHPDQRGWCAPASLAMLLAYWGRPQTVPDVAANVYDESYGGTGNWAFNTAYAGQLGLRGALVYLAGLDHAAAFIAAGVPLALSFAWNAGDLPGAPLDQSTGHLAVLRGFTAQGDPLLNDPAQPALLTVYERAAFERVWLAHGGVAFALAPVDRSDDLMRLANE